MSLCRRAGARYIVPSVFLAAVAIAPALAHSQALTVVPSSTRIAGTLSAGWNGDSNAPRSTSLNGPSYIVFDASGNQYISDTQNNCVRKIDTFGNMAALVGLSGTTSDTCSTTTNPEPTPTQGLYQPTGLAVDTAGDLYIADSKHNCVRELPAGDTGVAHLTTVAGTCGTANTLTSATPDPNGLAVDAAGDLFIAIQDTEATPADSVYQVLRQTSSSICVIAGAASTQVPNACAGITGTAQLNAPSGVAFDAIGDLFIADTGNSCVRELAGLTTLQTAVGQCANDNSGNSQTALGQPYGLAFSPTQALLITESSPSNVVTYVFGSSAITLTAGLPSGAPGSYSTSQDGQSALNDPLSSPRGIAVDASGNLYLADSGNSIERELSSNVIFPASPTPVGNASATQAIIFTINQNVNLSLSTNQDFTITSSTCTGAQSTAATGAPPATCQVDVSFTPTYPGLRRTALKLTDSISGTTTTQGLQAIGAGAFGAFTPGTANTLAGSLSNPAAVAVDAAGDTYVLESGATAGASFLIRIPAGGGNPQVVVPQGAGLVTPSALTIDSAGNIFIADSAQGTIARLDTAGALQTGFITGLESPAALYVDSFDNLYISEAGSAHSVIEAYASGIRRTISSSFVSPAGISIDNNGILYVADSGGHYVYKLQDGQQQIFAGNGTTSDSNTGQATGTGLIAPTSLAVDAAGDLYIADADANRIFTIFVSTTNSGNNISAIFGTGVAGDSGDGGPGNLARLNNPSSIALDGSNNLFVVDKGNSALRDISYPRSTLTFANTLVNQSAPVVQQNITNLGNSELTLATALAISDPQFTLDPNTTTCGNTITGGTTCNIGVIFSPTTTGTTTATLTATSNASNSPEVLTLIGVALPIAPPAFTIPVETEVYGHSFIETILPPATGPAPTGAITFAYGSQVLCSINGSPLPSTCTAVNTGLAVGMYTVTITYSGDANYIGSVNTSTVTITKAPLTLGVNNLTRTYNTPNPTLTGTLFGVANGDNFQVSYSTTATLTSPAGTYPITGTITAVAPTLLSNYSPAVSPGTLTVNDTSGTGGTGTGGTGTGGTGTGGTGTGGTTNTTTNLTTSLSPAPAGSRITFTAVVTATAATPTGSINFLDGATLLGTATLDNTGTASFSSTTLTLGTHTITANYIPSGTFNVSSGSVTQVIAALGSFTLSSPPPSQFLIGAGTTTFQITATSVGGFTGQVNLTCSGLPADAACAFGSNPALTAGGSITTPLTITTTAADAALHLPSTIGLAPITIAATLPFELTGLTVLFSGIGRRKRLPARLRLLLLIIASISTLALAGCGCPPTTYKTYTVTIAGSSPGATTQTTTVVLSVGSN